MPRHLHKEAARIGDGAKAHLFRSAAGRTGALTEKPMNRIDAWQMVQRRAAGLGMKVRIGCHTFRATGITAYLEAGGTLENAQATAGHESPRTTKAVNPAHLIRLHLAGLAGRTDQHSGRCPAPQLPDCGHHRRFGEARNLPCLSAAAVPIDLGVTECHEP